MRYSRGRIIALTVLSVTIMLALFSAGLFYNFRNLNPSALSDPSSLDPYYIPTFDDLYQRIPLGKLDSGTTTIGQGAKFTLVEESYNRGVLKEFLNKDTLSSYRTLQEKRRDGYPYAVFTNDQMRSITNGLGANLEIPVIMLDPYNYDDIVLFELTDLYDMPNNLSIKRDGQAYADGVNLHAVSNNITGDQVYKGIPNLVNTGKAGTIRNSSGTDLLNIAYVPNSKVDGGYDLVIKDMSGNYLFMEDANHNLVEAQTIPIGTGNNDYTLLFDNTHTALYRIDRNYDSIANKNQTVVKAADDHTLIYKFYDAQIQIPNGQDESVRLSNDFTLKQGDNQYTSYNIGAVAYNSKALRGMFREQGLYEISFELSVANGDGVPTVVNISFAFAIVNKVNYTNFPRFNTDNRVPGYSEIYSYSYESEYPVVTYSDLYFNVEIKQPAPEYFANDASIYDERELRFYNIGEYHMISGLQYYSRYLYANRKAFAKRGVDSDGYIQLNRYTKYESVLNILGFQAYYGGQHSTVEYVGPKPFFDSNDSSVSSDISAWVRDKKMTAAQSGTVVDFENMNVSNALEYSNELANYITNSALQPVRTNFPPVKLLGNVAHATGAGVSGETAAVLSTVAFRPAYGTGDVSIWDSRTYEVGAPFEEAGEYVVSIYFRVNGKMCQQTFYFEIVNGAKITFEVTANDVTKTYYAGDLELNQKLHIEGSQVTIKYDGQKTLGQFEVLPTIELAFANLGEYTYRKQKIQRGDDGSFGFILQEGQYRMTIKYGAHWKSTTVFGIIVDKQKATGIKVATKSKTLSKTNANLPDNVAVVGAGEVALTWDKKPSGVEFNKVLYEFYEMQLERPGEDPNEGGNYELFSNRIDQNGKIQGLHSAYAFANEASNPNDYVVIPTQDGERWTVSEDGVNPLKFTKAGLYRFIIVDAVGNETPYVLIIDDTTPTFTQSGAKPQTASNMVNFEDATGVQIGFGDRKLINQQSGNTFGDTMFVGQTYSKTYEDLQTIFEGLSDAGVLLNSAETDYKTVISIPLARMEISEGGGAYRDVSLEDWRRGYLTLKKEETFYFRATDVLGNVGEYYIILTHDVCLGSVYAEAAPLTIISSGNNIGRGMVKEEPNSSTSVVTMTGGVTNRNYVTFSFNQQKSDSLDFRVMNIYLQYYPLTFDKTSKNYPFAEKPANDPKDKKGNQLFARHHNDGSIYDYDSDRDADGGTIRLALFNNSTTPAGMYILTRVYNQISAGSSDKKGRDYWFIVDSQGMLTYQGNNSGYFAFNDQNKFVYQYDDVMNTVDYETKLNVHFADNKQAKAPQAKDAYALDFKKNDNILSSNRVAWVNGFVSKYSCYHDSITYNIINDREHYNHLAFEYNDVTARIHNYNFAALTPRFSYINDTITTNLGDGSNTWSLGDPASRTKDQLYQLVVADNARNISCELVNGNVFEIKVNTKDPTSANYAILNLNIDTECGTAADVILSENKIIGNSRMEYDGTNYLCIVDPIEVEQLKFQFASDPESMYVDVDIARTTASWTWSMNGETGVIELAQPTPKNTIYSYDLMRDFLGSKSITDGASLSVSLITYDDKSTNYIILFDREKPNYNLARIKAEDNLARTLQDSEMPDQYVYGLSEDFVFEIDSVNNRYLDTKEITYREVDYSGEGTQQDVAFKLYTGAAGEKRIPFAALVGLRDNEMRYYIITEKDYVGHTNWYMVQIQGSSYVNAVNFIGATSEDGAEIQIGIEMHTSASSVHQFFLQNNSFKFQSGDEFYMVLDKKATWYIGGEKGSDIKNEEKLINALNNWINIATQNGTKCSYTLYDRIGDVETFEFYNLREDAIQMQLDCYQPSATSTIITLEVKNLEQLPRIMFDSNLDKLYKIEVLDKTTSEYVQNAYFSLYGSIIPADVSHELVIKVVDPFGRVSLTEYHQQTQSTINFKPYGNTVTEDGIIYIGDERGVDFSYMRTVYSVLIYDATTDELKNDLQSFVSNDVISYKFKPTQKSNKLEMYRIVATGRASGAVLFDQTFAFDTRLPVVEWKNASDQSIEVNNRSFVSAVTMDLRNSTVTTRFPAFISYTRTYNDAVESLTLKKGTDNITFYQVGTYEVTLRNTVWAKETYKFEIVQVDDALVLVYDDGKQIQASDSKYRYHDEDGNINDITRYVFTAKTMDNAISEYKTHGLEIKLGQTDRVLAGNETEGTDYYEFDQQNSTLIWCLAFAVGEDYSSPIYFATTGVSVEDLNVANSKSNTTKISLQLNDNPANPSDKAKTYTVVPSKTAYDIVYNNFFTTKDSDRTLNVKLFYDDMLVDDFGAPCYLVKGNLILVDCYYNGTLIKTLGYKDVFTIDQNNAGYYEFVVHDLVGNYLYFGSSNDEKSLDYKQNRYMLAVLTKPVVSINGKRPVNGMIYNDGVELKLVDYGKENFLDKYYNTLMADGYVTKEAYSDFFNEYFRITKVDVTYNGETLDPIIPDSKQTSFYWNQTGKYSVTVTYRIYGTGKISNDLTSYYSFEIIPSMTVRENYNMSIYPDMPVVKITRDGYDIADYNIYVNRDDKNDKYLAFNANVNPGCYVVTLQTYDAILQDYVEHEIQFNIQHKDNSASSYFILSTASGAGTTNAVVVYYNPYWLYKAQGNVVIVLEKDCEVKDRKIIDASIEESQNYDSQELFNVSEAGLYCVTVRNAEGNVVYSDSWTIEPQQSSFGYVILGVVAALAVFGLLLFLRLRRRMTTK